MANEKISELPSGAPAQPTDAIPIARAGANYSLAASAIAGLGALNVRISGNTLGTSSLISTGTVVLGGGNNITLSQVGNTIAIVGGAGAGGNFSAGVSTGGNSAGNTGITGTQLVLAGGPNITLSQATGPNGATVSISGGAGGAGGGINASLFGNTSGVLSLISSGTLFLAGGNNVTLSQNGNSVTISANTAAAATVTISAGTTSGSFGGITFSNSNNISFGLNNGTITATASQSVQSGGIYFQGNTAGQSSSSTYDARSLSVSAGGNLSAGWSNGSLYFTNQSGAFNGAGMSTGGNTTGNTGLVSQQLVLVGGNNITLSGSVAGGSGTISINAVNQTLGLYAESQTYGQSSSSTYDARSLSIVGAGNVSVGMSAGSFLISGGTAGSGNIYLAGNTTGQSSSSSYALSSLNVLGGGLVSVGWSLSTLVISAPATTGLTQSIYAVSNTTQSSSATQTIGQLSFAGAGNISVGASNGSVVISGAGGGAAMGISTFGNTAGTTGIFNSGTYVMVGSGPISLSQSTNTNGATLSVNGPPISSISVTGNASISVNGSTISIGANAAAITIGGNSTSAGAGYSNISTGTAFLAGGNNITLSQNGASITISGGGGGGATSAGFYALGNTTQNSSSTLALSALSFNGLGEITVGYSNGSIQLSAPPSSIGVSNIGNTSGNTGAYSGQVVFAGGNNITLSVSSAAGGAQTITISGGAGGGQTTGGLYALGNTTQNSSTTLALSAYSFNALGAMTAGFSNGSIQLSAPATSSLSATGGLSVSVNGSTISIGQGVVSRYIYPDGNALTTIGQLGNATLSVQYVAMPCAVSASRLDVLMSMSYSTSAGAGTQTYQYSGYAVVYTKNVSTLSSLSSGSTQSTYTLASNTAGNTQFTQAAIRPLSIPINMNFSQGEYFVGVNIVTANTAGSATYSMMGGPAMIAGQNYAEIGNQTATSTNVYGGMGLYSAATTGSLAAISLSAINQTGANLQSAAIALVFRNI
jgi:hypothetical protein